MSKSTSETFHFFNFQHYQGANLYLNSAAVVFDLALSPDAPPLAIKDYQEEIGQQLPQLLERQFDSAIDLIAQTIAEVSKLEMELDLGRLSLQAGADYHRIAVQSLDEQVSYGVIDLVGDWLEAIARGEEFSFPQRLRRLQDKFRRSFYGGPTTYALWRAACQRDIPTFYLPPERLLQYGYGKYQVRGIATTFDCDSHLDSDFATQKDDCKDFLAQCGFPVPPGKVVHSLAEALAAAAAIGYPVAVKPVAGHKGIGVTANVPDKRGLELAFEQAAAASAYYRIEVIVEQNIPGRDFRLLCVGGKFVAALERRPPFVIGDGQATIATLIERENATLSREDTPTSPLAKIIVDEALEDYLEEQRLSLHSVPAAEEVIYLRKVANISAGGVSVDVTSLVHPDNRLLAEEIAQYLRLVCLGVDLISVDVSQSWKEGNCGIIEINSAPGVFMHLKPAIGEPVDVPRRILEFLFPPEQPCRMPTITFNRLEAKQLQELMAYIWERHPDWLIGGVSQQGIWLNDCQKRLASDYNSSVQSLLRHPQLDCLIAVYPEVILEREGMAYAGSNLIVLDEPTEKEMILARDLLPAGRLIVKQDNQISLKTQGDLERQFLGESASLRDVYFQEVERLIFPRASIQ